MRRPTCSVILFSDPFEDGAPHGALPAVRPVLLGVLADAGIESERAMRRWTRCQPLMW